MSEMDYLPKGNEDGGYRGLNPADLALSEMDYLPKGNEDFFLRKDFTLW